MQIFAVSDVSSRQRQFTIPFNLWAEQDLTYLFCQFITLLCLPSFIHFSLSLAIKIGKNERKFEWMFHFVCDWKKNKVKQAVAAAYNLLPFLWRAYIKCRKETEIEFIYSCLMFVFLLHPIVATLFVRYVFIDWQRFEWLGI